VNYTCVGVYFNDIFYSPKRGTGYYVTDGQPELRARRRSSASIFPNLPV
jgi:hypothetical protein